LSTTVCGVPPTSSSPSRPTPPRSRR
jgi:hypothetical protein